MQIKLQFYYVFIKYGIRKQYEFKDVVLFKKKEKSFILKCTGPHMVLNRGNRT